MPKIITQLLAFAFCLCLFGCSAQNDNAEQSPLPAHPAENTKDEWIKQDIIKLFENVNDENWELLDCVVFDDKVYNAVGAAAFLAQDSICFAFFDEYGHYQHCGFDDGPASQLSLEYLGQGVISFQLEKDDGTTYKMKLSFSREGSNVNFKAESK